MESRYEKDLKTGKLVVKRAEWEKEWAVCPKCSNKGKGLGNCTQCYGKGYIRRITANGEHSPSRRALTRSHTQNDANAGKRTMKTITIAENERKIVNDACIETAFFAADIHHLKSTDGCPRLVGVELTVVDPLLTAEMLNLIDIEDPALSKRLQSQVEYDEGYLCDLGSSRHDPNHSQQ